mgnify:FL=1
MLAKNLNHKKNVITVTKFIELNGTLGSWDFLLDIEYMKLTPIMLDEYKRISDIGAPSTATKQI